MRPAFSLAGAAIAVMMLVSGCVQGGTDVVPPPAANADPVFASDEEALAAATEAYKAYLAMSDLIAQEGGKDPERIAPYVTEELLEQELLWNGAFATSRTHLAGNQNVRSTELQQISAESGQTFVAIYACVDVAAVKVLDESGIDVTTPALGDVLAQEVTFAALNKSRLILTGVEPWSGESFC
jgi:hypothetical protein